MIPLLLFAFVAGAGTAFSPCALPVLPAFLSASGTGGRRRPIGIALGLALTFTIVVAGLASLLNAIGLGADFLRIIAIVMLGGFGLALLIPRLGQIVERPLARLSQFGPKSKGDGFWSGVTIGGALGFVYAPCAGPILAAVIGVTATQGTSLAIIGIALSYAIGSSLVLLLLGVLGRKGIQKLGGSAFGARVQQVLGVILIATAVAMSLGLDTRFQTLIAKNLPGLQHRLRPGETPAPVQDQLGTIRGESKFAPSETPVVMGAALPVLGKAPEFAGLTDWINSEPAHARGPARQGHARRLLDLLVHQLHPHASPADRLGRGLPGLRAPDRGRPHARVRIRGESRERHEPPSPRTRSGTRSPSTTTTPPGRPSATTPGRPST